MAKAPTHCVTVHFRIFCTPATKEALGATVELQFQSASTAYGHRGIRLDRGADAFIVATTERIEIVGSFTDGQNAVIDDLRDECRAPAPGGEVVVYVLEIGSVEGLTGAKLLGDILLDTSSVLDPSSSPDCQWVLSHELGHLLSDGVTSHEDKERYALFQTACDVTPAGQKLRTSGPYCRTSFIKSPFCVAL